MRWLGRFCYKTLKYVLLLLVLILAAVFFLVGTKTGFHQTANMISNVVPGLDLGSMNGELQNGINTDTVSFKNEQIAISATGIASAWDISCLIDRHVCLENIAIEELAIETFPSDVPVEPTPDPIPLPSVVLPITLDVKNVLIKRLTFKAPGDAPVQVVENILLSATSDGKTLDIANLSVDYQNFSAAIQGTVTTDGDYPLNLTLKLNAENFLEEHDANVQLKLSNTVADMNLQAQINGAVQATVVGRVQPLQKSLPAQLSIHSPEAGWPLDTLQQAKATNIDLNVTGDMNDYAFNLHTTVSGEQIPSSIISLNGNANTERVQLPELSVLALGGKTTGSAEVSWKEGLTWVSQLSAQNINPAIQYPDVKGLLNANIQAQGDVVDGKWTLALKQANVNGTLRDYPFKLDTVLQKSADDAWTLEMLSLKNGKNTAIAKGTVSDRWDLNADINMPQLQNLWPGLAGGFNADLKLKGDLKTPDVVLNANSSIIKFNDILVEGFSIKADVKKAAEKDSSLSLAIGKINVAEQEILSTRLNIEGSLSQHNITFFTDGPQKTAADIVAQGSLDKQFNWHGELNKTTFEVPAHKIVLLETLPLEWNNKTKKFSADAHCWAIQDARLCLKEKVLAENVGKATVALSNYGLDQLNPFLPAESTLKGQLDAQVDVLWGPEQAGGYQITLKTDIDQGGVNVIDPNGGDVTFNYETLSLNTIADAIEVSSQLNIQSRTMGTAKISAKMDPASNDKDISGNIDLSGFQISFLKAFLPDFETITGEIGAKGELTGSLTEPQFNGNIGLSKLIVRADVLPLDIDSGTINAAVTGKRANITGDIKSGEGNLDVKGNANWQHEAWRAEVLLEGQKLNIQQAPLTQSVVNPKVSILAQPNTIRIRGNVDVPMARIDIKEVPRGAVVPSADVIVIEDEKLAEKKKEEAAQSGSDMNISVTVQLGDDIRLSGYGLNASLTGDMRVSLRNANPVQLGGELRIYDGIYKKYGQDLTISDGQVLFVGPIDQTSLDIKAVREIESEDRIAGLQLTGRIANPEVALFTEPADKQEESILSYIVLGRDIGEASDSESNLMQTALLALTLKGGQGLATNLADNLGIKELTLDSRGQGDNTEVVVSGRVNDKLLLRYGQSVFGTNEPTMYLRYDITKKLYLEAAKGVSEAIDIFYSFSF